MCSPESLESALPCDDGVFNCTPGDLVGGVIGDVASSAWESVCKSFAEAAVTMLKGFADAFAVFPNVDLTSTGVRSVYGISLGIAGFVAALLLLVQIARTVITHDGNALAQGFVGIGKAGLAFMLTLTVASAGLVAADALTVFIINQTFGNTQGLTTKLTTLFELNTLNNSPSLLLLMAVIGIVLVGVLWFELLLRNAAVAVLIGTSPIAAAGMASEITKQWWSQLMSATIRLIILKPVIALVFAVGFGLFGNETKDLGTLLAGMLVLLLAVLAWPALARFFTFAAAHPGGPSGLGAVLGFAAGRAADSAGGDRPAGVAPEQFGQHAEARTMASFASRTGGGTAAAGGAAGAGGAGGAAAGAGGAAAGAAGAGIPLLVAKGLQTAQRAVNSLAGRMEQTAGHAGLSGASSYAAPAGYARPIPTAGLISTAPPTGGADPGEDRPIPDGPTGPSSGPSPASPADPVSSNRPAPPAEPARRVAVEPPNDTTPPPAAPPPSGTAAEPRQPATAEPARSTAPPAPPAPSAAGHGRQAPAATPPVPQQRPASPVEHLRPAPSRPAESGPVEHVKPAPASPIEFEKGDPS
jgi:hypothetical protein